MVTKQTFLREFYLKSGNIYSILKVILELHAFSSYCSLYAYCISRNSELCRTPKSQMFQILQIQKLQKLKTVGFDI